MNLTERIGWAAKLGEYMLSDDPEWVAAKELAHRSNPWFIPPFIDLATRQIALGYLSEPGLTEWTKKASVPENQEQPMQVGLVMASNLPLVGFHDWLCILISGHHGVIKPSSQDQILFNHLRSRLLDWEPRLAPYIRIEERLNGSDAYIATGSNNTSRYFEYYFGRFPHIIRSNRTSIAVLTGAESETELLALSEDIYTYFGRGCRNVTQLLVPREYDFEPLLKAGETFRYLADHHKFKNNYDYQLALRILNKEFYMTNGIVLFLEQPSLYAPIGVVHYQYYDRTDDISGWLDARKNQIQCQLGWQGPAFGSAQRPGLTDYADGVDTLSFLLSLAPPR